MANVSLIVVTRDGVAMATAATADGQAMTIPDNDGNVVIEVTNPTGGPLNLVTTRTLTVAGEQLDPDTDVIAAGDTLWFGPFPPFVYNASDNTVEVTPDAGLEIRGLRF